MVKFRLIRSVYNSETESFTPSEAIPEDSFYMVIFNTNTLCSKNEEIQWFALMDEVDGTLDLSEITEMIKVGQSAQRIRQQKTEQIIGE